MNSLAWPVQQHPKQIRSRCIVRAMRCGGYSRAVVFSCGNAGRALQQAAGDDIQVLHLGPEGMLEPRRWFAPEEVALWWPGWFDGTSGHLPAWLMLAIGEQMQAVLGDTVKPGQSYDVPTGSGETVMCLRWAFPEAKFRAVYGGEAGAHYEPRSPLNPLVVATGETLTLPTLVNARDKSS